MRETETLRGLRFRGPVAVTIEDRVAMRAYVNRAIDDVQLERATRRYLALGVLDPALDVRALLVSVMDEELIGYYDPTEKRLAVRTDIAASLAHSSADASHSPPGERGLLWRATVVHELVHALQDQHFALGEAIERERTTDEDDAFGALVEGDATLVMLGYTAQQMGQTLAALAEHPEQILSAMARSPEQLTGALRRAPALLREPLLFRYREGAHFCAQLFRRGGWSRVDAAHRAPPRSTLAIREAQRYLAHVPEAFLALPALDALLAGGFDKRDEDTLGALELSILLDTDGSEAQDVVSAWRGDRYAVLEREGSLASVWWLRFSTPHAAKRVAAAFAHLHDEARMIARHANTLLVARGLDGAAFGTQARSLPQLERTLTSSKASARSLVRGDPLATAVHQH